MVFKRQNSYRTRKNVQYSSAEPIQQSHLIFQLPEIVEQIIQHLLPNPTAACCPSHKPASTHRSSTKSMQDVLPCLYVNWLWHDCVTRYTWRHVSFEDTRADYEQFLRFTSVISCVPVPNLKPSQSTVTAAAAALAVATPSGLVDDKNGPSNSILKKTDALRPLFPALASILPIYNRKQSATDMSSSTEPQSSISSSCPTPSLSSSTQSSASAVQTSTASALYHDTKTPGLVSNYQHRIRSLTLRKIKERNINDPLRYVGHHAPYLNMLDIYICDYVTNAALYPFLEHGQLTYLSLAGCQRITDEAILQVANTCPRLEHLDLRACGHVTDVSISRVALQCPLLRHLNVGRVKDRQHITDHSIELMARHTQVSVLGLAGCDISDASLTLLAECRREGIERISINNCYRVSNLTVRAYARHCPKLSVFEMKECHRISDWEAVATLVQRKVLLTLCDQQNRACEDWAKKHGITLDVRAPVK